MGKFEIVLPDFVVIGANKAGTTSVANYLNMHQRIQMSRVKEPMFFSTTPSQISADASEASLANPFFTLTLSEYSAMFESDKDGDLIYGEASTAYLANPAISSSLMRKIVPEVKIIAILRDPVERAISAYKMCYGNKIEERCFKEIVDVSLCHHEVAGANGVRDYVRNGLYYQLLEPYLRFFDRGQILLTSYDWLCDDPHGFLGNIFGFLGLESAYVDVKARFNTAEENLNMMTAAVSEYDVDRLREFYRDENLRLQSVIDFDISHWIRA